MAAHAVNMTNSSILFVMLRGGDGAQVDSNTLELSACPGPPVPEARSGDREIMFKLAICG